MTARELVHREHCDARRRPHRESNPPLHSGAMSDISRVGVVGSGLMGSGIAEVCARAGLDVVVTEVDAAAAEAGQRRLGKSLDRGVSSGKLSEDERDAALPRISFTTDIGDLADRQLVVEAVVEDEQSKVDVFRALDKVVEDRDADARQQHQLDPDHEARHRHRAARAGDRHPLLQPGAGAAAGRARRQPDDVARHDRRGRTTSPPTCCTRR